MTLVYMSPCPATKQIIHATVTNAVFFGEGCYGHVALSVALTRISNLLFSEFCVRMIPPAWLASLRYLICHIVGARAQEEMGRITTRRVVAAMADYKTILNRTVRQFVCDAMGQKRLTTGADVDSSIAKVVCTTLPFPAFIGAMSMHLQPKSISNWAKVRIVTVDKTKWFALYMATSILISFCNTGLLSTPAVAISVGDFLRGLLCGIITHVNSLLSAIGHSVGLVAQSPRFFIGSQEYYTTGAPVNQVRLSA